MTEAPPEYESELPDLSQVPLSELATLDDSVLSHAVRRLLQEADRRHDVVAGFNSSI